MPHFKTQSLQNWLPFVRWRAGFKRWSLSISLRVKGLLSLGVVALYAITMSVLLTQEQSRLPLIVLALERLHRQDEKLIALSLQGTKATMAVSEVAHEGANEARIKQLFLELARIDSLLSDSGNQFPLVAKYRAPMHSVAKEMAHSPERPVINQMRTILLQLLRDVDLARETLRSDKKKMLSTYQSVHDNVTLQTMFFLFLGLVVVGAVMTIFFTRLTWDVTRVGARAMAIVKGYRGKALKITRGDEVGGLMRAVNQMQLELRERERQLELSRQQQFHHEKMAAVGSLAAAVAHEINNPIMAISGLANVLLEQRGGGDAAPDGVPEMILEQAQRIASITRQIAEFSTPQSQSPQLFDLNGCVRSTANFVRFDQRFRCIDLQVNLDSGIGALFAVADHITQVIINLLINAADALECNEPGQARVVVATRCFNGLIELSVQDNGPGMSPETLARACEEFFTTKPKGKGSGLGLFLCKTLVEQNSGVMSIESAHDHGTQVFMRFPATNELE